MSTEVIQNPNTKLSQNKKVYFLVGVLFVLLLIVLYLRVANQRKSISNNTQNVTLQAGADQTGKFFLVPQSVETKVGQTFSLDIMLSVQNPSLDGADVVITYDPEVLSVVGEKAEKGTLFPSYLKNINDGLKGKISLTGVTFEAKPAPFSGEASFGKITFQTKKEGKTMVNFLFNPQTKDLSTIIENGTSKNILGSAVGANITITR